MDFEKIKNFLLPLFTMMWAFIQPIHGLMFATGALVLSDMVTGIAKAWRKGGWKAIRSRRMRETIGKGLLYMIAILAGFFLDYITELGLAARAVAGVIALTEVKSILENISELTGVDVREALLSKLKPPANTDDQDNKPKPDGK